MVMRVIDVMIWGCVGDYKTVTHSNLLTSGGLLGRDLPNPALTSPHEWNRLHRTPPSFPVWPKPDLEREKEKEREAEREREREREQERERDLRREEERER